MIMVINSVDLIEIKNVVLNYAFTLFLLFMVFSAVKVLWGNIERFFLLLWMKLPRKWQGRINIFFMNIISLFERKNTSEILLNRLVEEHSVVHLEMDSLYAEHLVKLFKEYYTNCIVVWHELQRSKNIDVVTYLIKKNIITKTKLAGNCVCCGSIKGTNNQRRLETAIVFDDCALANEVAKALNILCEKGATSCQPNSTICYVVPMLTTELIEDIKSCRNKNIWVFTIIEIPNKDEVKKLFINDIANGKDIRYEPLIPKNVVEKVIGNFIKIERDKREKYAEKFLK